MIPCAESIPFRQMARISERDIGIIERQARQEHRQSCGDRHRRGRKQDRFAFREDGARDRASVVRWHG